MKGAKWEELVLRHCFSARQKVRISDLIRFIYSKTLNNEYTERIHQMSYSSYSSFSDNGMLQIFRFLSK